MIGQMSDDERRLIFETVRDTKPKLAVECGTFYGGGSTLAAARGLAESGSGGVLATWDIDEERTSSAMGAFAREFPDLATSIEFHTGDFLEGIAAEPAIHYATLDGPEDGPYTVACLNALASKMAEGSPVIIHDWFRPKCHGVRELIAERKEWRVEREQQSYLGIVLLRRTDRGR